MDTEKQRQRRHDDVRLTESGNTRSKQLNTHGAYTVASANQQSLACLSGSQRRRPCWFIDMKYQTCCSSDIEVNVASVWQRDQCLLHIGQLQVNGGDGNGDGGTSRDLDSVCYCYLQIWLYHTGYSRTRNEMKRRNDLKQKPHQK